MNKNRETQMNDRALHIELIKTMLQVNNDDARSLLLYGTIPLGIIVFLFPVFYNPTAPWIYWCGLLLGTLLLAFGAFGIIWYSRKQIENGAKSFGDTVSSTDQNTFDNIEMVRKFRNDLAIFRNRKWEFRMFKVLIIVGMAIYGLLFFYGMTQTLCQSSSFFGSL